MLAPYVDKYFAEIPGSVGTPLERGRADGGDRPVPGTGRSARQRSPRPTSSWRRPPAGPAAPGLRGPGGHRAFAARTGIRRQVVRPKGPVRDVAAPGPCPVRSLPENRACAGRSCCCGQICWGQQRRRAGVCARHRGLMAHDDKTPMFSWRAREQLFGRRILVLDGPLDDDNGTLLITQLLTLAAQSPEAGISLWIHSPGGSVPSMLAIRDVMRLVPCEVSTLALGLACSAGQFLLSSGTPGKRYALPHARVLMHQGSAGIGGSAVEVEVQADDLRHTATRCSASSPTTPGSPSTASTRTRCTTAGTPRRRPVEYGFIDHIVESFDQVVPRNGADRTVSHLKRSASCPPRPEGELDEQLHDSQCRRRSIRAASGSWTSTRICSPNASSTSARPSTRASRTR